MHNGFQLDAKAGYFRCHGVDVMAFSDIYPSGHQSGLNLIMHGSRVASNGDLRLEQTPGQWQPTPKMLDRQLDTEQNAIRTTLRYPDLEGHLRGFNPMLYPDLEMSYTVSVQGEGSAIRLRVDLEEPLPETYVGKVCFNLELFPGELFGKPWIMDGQQGIFPTQPNGPVRAMPSNHDKTAALRPLDGPTANREWLAGKSGEYSPIIADDLIAAPYACGRRFTIRPEEPLRRLTIESLQTELKLYDGRMNHNNGWFVISSEVPADCTEGAVEWLITPSVAQDWRYAPVVQTSQVGYMPNQPKTAVIELDLRDTPLENARLMRITENGQEEAALCATKPWGQFLRYQYLHCDFSSATQPGLYQLRYGDSASSIIRIGQDVYDRGVWQPVLEYFLPVQMCHMRVSEKYRVWHGHCHRDDARMAPVNFVHFDGYRQGESTLTKYHSGDPVPGLDAGGWHDAGDFDLRIESQAGEAYILALTYETFGVDYDATTIDQSRHVTEIHQPDGKNDILQQIEHGMLSVIGGYESLGRLYRGIICNDLRQYVLLGDAAAMTDGIAGNEDDRWVFTEENSPRELTVAAQLAAVSRALSGFNDDLAARCLKASLELYAVTAVDSKHARMAKTHAAAELLLTTGEERFRQHLLEEAGWIAEEIEPLGWIAARVLKAVDDAAFTDAIRGAVARQRAKLDADCAQTPYGIPYQPHIWGAGWGIQNMAFRYYFLYQAFPDLLSPDLLMNALNFVLGCHPGSNTASFASGVGTISTTAAYGMNRADFSFIPGGVVSGTALIRPDFPELLVWPYLWQQTEYVLGGGSSNYLFLVLAVRRLLGCGAP